MPFRKKSYAKKRPYKRSYKSKGGGYLDTAARALAVAYAVKKLINVEFHSINTNLPTDPNSSGSVTNLSPIAQGDDRVNRQGNKIRAKYLKVAGLVKLHASATVSNIRLMIVRDNNGSTTIPAITDLFGSVAIFEQGQNKIGDSQTNSRFSILWDHKMTINTENPQQYFEYSMELDHHIFFTGTAGTDEGKGHVYALLASNEATNDPIMTGNMMLKFIDN